MSVLCTSGSASDARNVTQAEKDAIYTRYQIVAKESWCDCPKSTPTGCEVDHLISLEIGGANVPENLWPQPYCGPWNAHMKDKLEDYLHEAVCVHKTLTLVEAQTKIRTDWTAAFKEFFPTLVPSASELSDAAVVATPMKKMKKPKTKKVKKPKQTPPDSTVVPSSAEDDDVVVPSVREEDEEHQGAPHEGRRVHHGRGANVHVTVDVE